MIFKDCYSIIIKKLLVGIFVLQGLSSAIIVAAAPQVTIINGTKGAIAFSLVRTKRGTKYKELYVVTALKEPKKSDSSAWDSFKHSVQSAFNTLKRTINVRILMAPGEEGKERVTINNFPQKLESGTKLFAYDRVLWVVPIGKLDKLVASLNKGTKDIAVTPLEVGSSLTAEIIDKNNNGKFTLKTTGKFMEGAKSIFTAFTEEDVEPVQEEGESLSSLTENKIKELKRKYEVKKESMRTAQNKAKQKEIADKYRK